MRVVGAGAPPPDGLADALPIRAKGPLSHGPGTLIRPPTPRRATSSWCGVVFAHGVVGPPSIKGSSRTERERGGTSGEATAPRALEPRQTLPEHLDLVDGPLLPG